MPSTGCPSGTGTPSFSTAAYSLKSASWIHGNSVIRSVVAGANDAAFCLLLAHNAVHAAMTGRTNMVVGHWGDTFTHIPIPLAVSERKKIDPNGRIWSSVLAATGQPAVMI